MDMDEYEYIGTIMKLPDDWQNFVELADTKSIGYVEVGNANNPEGVEKYLRDRGYETGDSVLVILQD